MRRPALLLAAIALVLGACGGGDRGDGDAALFCGRLDRLTGNDPFRSLGDTASGAEVEAAFAALLARAEELADVAPEAIRPAAVDYLDAATALESLLAGAAYDPADVDTRAYQAQQVAYVEAARRLERYLTAEC
jgi:hypothetical protein